jgi:hypothetical protein
MAVLPDSRVVVWTIGGQVVGVTSDGAPDLTFGPNGVANLDVLGTVTAGLVDAQRRLVVVGITTATTQPAWFIRRYWL